MARGRKTHLIISLAPEERHTLLSWQRSTSIPVGLARRGRIILLLADGIPISHIALTVGISRRFVYKWAKRFLEQRLNGLAGTSLHLPPAKTSLRATPAAGTSWGGPQRGTSTASAG